MQAVDAMHGLGNEALMLRALCIADRFDHYLDAMQGAGPLRAGAHRACGSEDFYQVLGSDGTHLAGVEGLPGPRQAHSVQQVSFYDGDFLDRPVRLTAVHHKLRSAQSAAIVQVRLAEWREESYALPTLPSFAATHAGLLLAFALAWLLARPRDSESAHAMSLAHTAHELRTPLAVLDVQLQAGLRGDVPAEQVLHDMRRTVQRAVAVSQQMLGQTPSSRGSGSAGVCAIDQLLAALALELSPLIADKNLAFLLDAPPTSVQAPEWRLWQVFSNLLANAIRHAPHGGNIEIRLRPAASGALCVSVWNSGCGIDETRRRSLFAPYWSGKGGSGIGLGLALCEESVLALGGSIDLRNRRAGGGVEALVCLPASIVAR